MLFWAKKLVEIMILISIVLSASAKYYLVEEEQLTLLLNTIPSAYEQMLSETIDIIEKQNQIIHDLNENFLVTTFNYSKLQKDYNKLYSSINGFSIIVESGFTLNFVNNPFFIPYFGIGYNYTHFVDFDWGSFYFIQETVLKLNYIIELNPRIMLKIKIY